MISLYKTTEELLVILSNLLKVSENECVEFKRAKNNFDVDTLGKYFSALGNEANRIRILNVIFEAIPLGRR